MHAKQPREYVDTNAALRGAGTPRLWMPALPVQFLETDPMQASRRRWLSNRKTRRTWHG
jgi:hypothetical protein